MIFDQNFVGLGSKKLWSIFLIFDQNFFDPAPKKLWSKFLIFNQNFRFLAKISLVQDHTNSDQYLRILVENNWITKINGHQDEGGWVETKT